MMEHKMITNEQVVERVMRMGVEHRSGVQHDRLWDVAREQLKTEAAKRRTIVPSKSWEDWKSEDYRLAFMYVDGKLAIVRITNPDAVQLVGWRSPYIPEVTL